MAFVTYDAQASAHSASTASLSWSHTCSSGSGRALVVGVLSNPLSGLVTGVTYAGVSMTKMGSVDPNSLIRLELWVLAAPATGANNVVVTLSAASFTTAGSISFTGAADADVFSVVSTFSSGGSASPSISVAVGERGMACALATFNNQAPWTITGEQTDRWTDTSAPSAAGSTAADANANGLATISYSISSDACGIIGLAVKAPIAPVRPAFSKHPKPNIRDLIARAGRN